MPPIVLDGTTGITTPGLTNTGTETLVNLTTTGNTTLGDATTDTLTVGVTGIVKDASGNVGIGTSDTTNQRLKVKQSADTGAASFSFKVEANANDTGLYIGYRGVSAATAADTCAINASYVSTGAFKPISFLTSDTERMRIDSSGNVGIGTSSPNATLHLGAGGATFRIGITASNQYGELYRDGTTGNIVLNAAQASFGNLVFQTTSTERMRIDSSGNVGIGSAPAARFSATTNATTYTSVFYNDNASVPYGLLIQYRNIDPNGTGSQFLDCFGGATTLRAQIRSNGGLANYSANNVNLSDRREKTNFAPAGDYLAKICAIPVQTFNYIDQNLEEDDGLTLGVVAQDVQAVAPELVMESNWAAKDEEPKMRLSIYQTDLQYALMKCIQEQQALITQLTNRITALEKK